MFEKQINEHISKEKEKRILNQFCNNEAVPEFMKKEAKLDFVKKWGDQ